MSTVYAIRITDENFDLITFLNGGQRPGPSSRDDHFVCELPVGPDTRKDEIMPNMDVIVMAVDLPKQTMFVTIK